MDILRKKRIIRKPDAGFTLIELLIVIVILAILAAIVVFAVGSTGSNAAASACKSDAKSLETALEAYKAQNNGSFPTAPTAPGDSSAWNVLLTSGGGTQGPYLRVAPPTNHYQVWWDSDGNVFVDGSGTGAYPTGSALLTDTSVNTNMNFDTSNGSACSHYAK